jgi:hypothetical protein
MYFGIENWWHTNNPLDNSWRNPEENKEDKLMDDILVICGSALVVWYFV